MRAAPLLVLLAAAGCAFDPAPGIFQSKEVSRNLECVRLSQAEAHERYPGQVPEPSPRGYLRPSDALVCKQRFLKEGERPNRDEAILSSLREEVGEISALASALNPGKLTWHVDAFYPDEAVAAKISVAAKVELAEHGQRVSDRVPVLAAGDIAVLSRLPASQAYPLACERYFAEQVLSESDVFLGVMLINERETQLHAGVCLRAQWQWLR